MIQSKIPQELKDKMLELRNTPQKNGKPMSYRAIAKNLKEYDINFHNVRKVLSVGVNELADSDSNFEFQGDNIVFIVNRTNTAGEKVKKRIEISIDELLEYCFQYVSLGGGKTIGKMSREYGIKPEALRLMFRRLNVSKDADVAPQKILDRIGELRGDEVVDEIIEDMAIRSFESKNHKKWILASERAKKNKANKVYKAFANMDNFLDHLNKRLENYEPEQIKFKYNKKKSDKEAVYIITDLHFCKMGTDEILKRLGYMVEDAINDDAKHINLLCLGDLCESFAPGGMHAGQEAHMELTGFDVYPFIVNALCSVVEEIAKHKSVSFHGITGNHDRIAQGRDGDMERTGGLAIYYMMQLRLGESMVTYYRPKWNTVIFDGIGYIIHHGDDRATNKDTSNIVMENRPNTEHMIIAMGDKHHYEGKNETNGISRLICPALAGVGEYDSRLRLSSYSGYVRITKNRFGMPEIIPKYLP